VPENGKEEKGEAKYLQKNHRKLTGPSRNENLVFEEGY
jgi:hypothetical protein